MDIKRIFCVLILIFLLSGCAGFRKKAEKYDLSVVGLETVRDRISENYGAVKSISGKFDFSYSTTTDRKQSKGSIFVNRSDTIYVEIKGLIGTTEAKVFIDADSLKAYNYSENLEIMEKSDSNSFRRITGISYDVNDIKDLFMITDENAKLSRTVKKRSDGITVRTEPDNDEYSFIYLDSRLLIKSAEKYDKRELQYKKEYDYYSNEDGIFFPRRIRIRTFNPPTKLTIFFTRLSINREGKIEI
ncbi:MAG: DUF4292 domain-containing protein [Candidatus Delongbacteria bacterium]